MGSNKQASNFEVTFAFLQNHIKKTYTRGNNITEVLKKLEDPDTNTWKPKLQFSTESDVNLKAQKNKQFELDYKFEFDKYMKQKNMYEENSLKSYAEIWDRCNKAMKAKIEAHKDYESEVYNKPIVSIRAIKEHSLNYEDNRYKISTILDGIMAFLTCRHKKKETLQDYTKQFKVAREIMNLHLGGGIVLNKYVKLMKGYDEKDDVKIYELTKEAD